MPVMQPSLTELEVLAIIGQNEVVRAEVGRNIENDVMSAGEETGKLTMSYLPSVRTYYVFALCELCLGERKFKKRGTQKKGDVRQTCR